MRGGSKSETITENIFREFYGNGAFIEKSAIPSHYGFKSIIGKTRCDEVQNQMRLLEG